MPINESHVISLDTEQDEFVTTTTTTTATTAGGYGCISRL